MLNLFLRKSDDLSDLQFSEVEYSRFDYIKRRYLHELNKIKEYYNNRDRAINNRHVISRLIFNLAPSIDLDDIDYLKIVSANAIYVSKQFNIVSNINQGKLLESQFYGQNSKEVLLYTEHNLDIFSLRNNWKEIDSIKLIYTDNTDLDFYIPNGTKDFNKETLSVFEIDIITMLMQYKYWATERRYNGMSTNTNVFVITILLPNILNNWLDLTIFNRYLELFQYGKCKEFVIKHPFNVLDFSTGIDSILKDILKHTVNKSMPLEQIINRIPSIINTPMLKTLKFNNPFYTRQSLWVIWISRIKYIRVLLELLGENGISRNRKYTYILPVEIRMLMNRDTELETILTPELYSNFTEDLEKIKMIVGTR